jgi:phosphoribosylformylglycinamidine synthase
MRIAVLRFPGSNCDQDALYALRDELNVEAEYVWHHETTLDGFTGVFLPGGFTFGDYLRCGAIAARSPIMVAVREFAAQGKPVLGVCNGFQVLCESGLLHGALGRNVSGRFVCDWVHLRREESNSFWLLDLPRTLRLPIAHGEGRFLADPKTVDEIEAKNLVAFRYCDQHGEVTEEANPNGSVNGIAGLVNEQGNVLGMMPHPERAVSLRLGGTDGLDLLTRFGANFPAFDR